MALLALPTLAQDALQSAARQVLSGPAAARIRAEQALRKQGGKAARALIDAIAERRKARAAVTPAAWSLLFEICPASETEALLRMRPFGSRALRIEVLRWLARRDLPGFRDVETLRAAGLVAFLDDEDEIATEAAKKLLDFDLPLVAEGLATRLLALITQERWGSRRFGLAVATAFAQLRAAGPWLERVFAAAEAKAAWLVPALLPAFAQRRKAVLAGRLDAWAARRNPAIAQAFAVLVARLDAEFGQRVDHESRLALYTRLARLAPHDSRWWLQLARVAVLDLARPEAAAPAFARLRRASVRANSRIEAACLAAIAARLSGQSAIAELERAQGESAELFERLRRARMQEDDDVRDFDARQRWRRLVPPKLGEDEVAQRRQRYLDQGGQLGQRWRVAGRQRIAVLLLAAMIFAEEGQAARAKSLVADAATCLDELEGDWDLDRFGETADLDIALQWSSGPLEYLQRALEGNEALEGRVDRKERERRLGVAMRNYAFLAERLAHEVPEQVLPPSDLQGVARDARERDPDERERVLSTLTSWRAAFYRRVGDSDKAGACLDAAIAAVKGVATWRNERMRASFWFDRAALALDLRDAKTAKARLQEFIDYYETSLRDVRVDPARYVDPKRATQFYSSQLSAGHISMAVLHNVLLGELDVARKHCRRAYELEDSPFNRALYACYLARDKKEREARALLASIAPAPPVYYNLGCCYALLGDADRALTNLRKDLEWNYLTRAARNRQREWAAKDRDLMSLRKDPRFVELVRPRKPGEGR